jgi:hypothetical protein
LNYTALQRIFARLHQRGYVRSQRAFSKQWLGRGDSYFSDFSRRGREGAFVSGATTRRLRRRLVAIAAHLPPDMTLDFAQLVTELDDGVAATKARSPVTS